MTGWRLCPRLLAPKPLLAIFVVVAALLGPNSLAAVADEPPIELRSENVSEGPPIELVRLRREVDSLKAEVAALRTEIRQLRRALDADEAPEPMPAQPDTPAAATAPTPRSYTTRTTQRFDGHTGSVQAVAISPDGRRGISTGDDGIIRVWDLQRMSDDDAYATPIPPGLQLMDLAFSPDGKTIAACGAGLFMLRADNGELLHQMRVEGGWTDRIAFSGDGRILASTGRGTVHLWDVRTGEEMKSSPAGMEIVRALDIAGDGRILCAGGYYNAAQPTADPFVRLWDIDSGKESLRLDYRVRTVFRDATLLAEDTHILTAGPNGSAREWDVATGKEFRLWRERGINCLAVSADRRRVAAGGNELVELWNMETGQVVDSLELPGVDVHSIALRSEGRTNRALYSGFHDRAVRGCSFRVPQEPQPAAEPAQENDSTRDAGPAAGAAAP